MKKIIIAAILVALVSPVMAQNAQPAAKAPAAVAPSAPAAPPLASGAEMAQESFGNWDLHCQSSPVHQCSVFQVQTVVQTRQRLLLLEVHAVGNNYEGAVVLPFGLDLKRNVSFQVDDSQPFATLPFETCMPSGCEVPIVFDPKVMAGLRMGTAIKIKVFALNNKEPEKETIFTVPLKNFGQAIDRSVILAK